MKKKKINVVGMGYVGIPVALSLALTGKWEVTGLDVVEEKIKKLNNSILPIGGKEPKLNEMLKKAVEDGVFHASTDFSSISDSYAVLINVQTPVNEKGIPDYSYLLSAAKSVGTNLKINTLVILESTVAPGTTVNIFKPTLEKYSSLTCPKDFLLSFSYERVMVGRLIHNLQNYPRIVGGIDERSKRRAVEIYRTIVKAEVIPTDILTAEVAKTVENAYRDVNIAFANEVALITESLGVDVFEVRRLVNNLPYDPSEPHANPLRNMHFPGAGVGGHCLPKDSLLLLYGSQTFGRFKVDAPLMLLSRKINNSMPVHFFRLGRAALARAGIKINEANVTIFGYAFLQDTDDYRNTPSKTLIDLYKWSGSSVTLHDPYVNENDIPGGVRFTRSIKESLKDSDLLAIVTAHTDYKELKPAIFKNMMRTPIVIDGRGVYRGIEDEFKKEGVEYLCLGVGGTLKKKEIVP